MLKRSTFLVLAGLATLGLRSVAAQQRSDITPVSGGATGGRFTPVSYTHLTLPTICSV